MNIYRKRIRQLLPDLVEMGINALAVKKDVCQLGDIANPEYALWLQETNGGYAFQGALRFFPISEVQGLRDITTWNKEDLWKGCYGNLIPKIFIFCEDAFGQQYAFDQKGHVSIFWAETGEVESLDLDFLEFLELIARDPYSTISFDLYLTATKFLNSPQLNEHFAFKVETALGGGLDVDNLFIMDSVLHLRALGKIAQQISNVEIGTLLKPAPFKHP